MNTNNEVPALWHVPLASLALTPEFIAASAKSSAPISNNI